MVKKILILITALMVILPLVSALDLNPFAVVKEKITNSKNLDAYLKEDFNEKYGVIQLYKTFMWLKNDNIAEYSLTKNTEQCLIDCEAEGKAILYRDMALFDDMKFYDKIGSLRDLDYKIYILETEEYVEETPIYEEVCEDVTDVKNGTTNKICQNVQTDVRKETKTREVWKEYKNEVLPAGNYKWKLEGKKKPTESIDFIPVASSKELSEWAWWNFAWAKRKQINIIGGSEILYNFTVFIKINYTSNMKPDYGDIRFLDSSSTKELYYYRENYNSSEAYFHVLIPSLNPGNNIIYMYYNNSGATTTSDAKNTFPLDRGYHSIFTLNNSNSKDIILSLNVTDGGKIKNTNLFDGGVQLASNKSLLGEDTTWNNSINEYRSWAWDLWIYPYNYSSTQNNDNGIIGVTPGGCDFVGFQPDIIVNSTGTIFGRLSKNCKCVNSIQGPQIALNSWTHVVYKYNSNKTYELWVNGVKQGTNSMCLSGTQPYTAKLPLGSIYGGPGGGIWNGTAIFDMLKVYNSTNALSDAWISRTYQNANSSNIIFGVEQSMNKLAVTLNFPINNYVSTSPNITFNCSATDDTAVLNLTLIIDGRDNYTITNNSANQNLSLQVTRILGDGNHNWTCRASDGTGYLNSDPDIATTLYLLTNTIPTIKIENITNISTISIPVTTRHMINASDISLNACWYYTSDNYTNTTVTCNSPFNINWNSGGIKTIYAYANDTIGNTNYTSGSFNIYDFTTTQNGSATTGEGSTQTFTLLINSIDFPIDNANANLWYNGKNYGYDIKTAIGSNAYYFTKEIVIPSGTGSYSGNSVDWYWVWNATNSVTYNTTTQTQKVYSVNLSDCRLLGGKVILNMSLKDEETKTLVNVTSPNLANIEVDILVTSLKNSSQTWKFSKQWINNNSVAVCVPYELLNYSTYRIDLVASYSATGKVNEFYYLDNGTLDNSGMFNSYTNSSISLYDLNIADST